jgi:cytochrome P450
MVDKTVVDFDHHSPEFAADPVGAWKALRTACPVAYTTKYDGFWVLTGYAETTQVARDDETFSAFHNPEDRSLGAGVMIPPTSNRFGLFEDHGDVHRDMRRVLLPHFSRASAEQLRPLIQDEADRAIDTFIEKGSCDLVVEFCSPVPAAATIEFLNLGDADVALYSDTFHKHMYQAADPQAHEDVIRGMVVIDRDIANAIADRRAHPRSGDPLSSLCEATVAGAPLSDQQIADVMHTLIGGGLDTTASALATTFMWLAENPAERKRMVENPDLMATAMEEFLRYFSTATSAARTVVKECEIGGNVLRPGERVMMSWAAANHDPAEFDQPDEIVLDRFPNRHTTFGVGGHRCIGSSIARVEFEVMLARFLSRIPEYDVDFGSARRYPSLGWINGFITLPITFEPGKKRTES